MASRVAASLALVFLVVAPITAYAATFPVDWNLSSDYSSWATKDISVGDELVFSYDMSHSVDVVSESDYSNCISSNPSFSDNSGKTTYKLTKEGAVYIICGTSGHCPGMQLQVNVKAAASPTSPTPTSSASPTPSSDTPTSETASPPPPPPPPPSNSNAASRGSLFGAASLLFGTFFIFVF